MGDVDRLIDEVRAFECLWKVNSKAYTDRSACDGKCLEKCRRDGKMSTVYMIAM